jgi:starch-binding outer membrane protein, SusD/RagB family
MKKLIIVLSLIAFFQACTTDFIELTPKVSKLESNAYITENDAFLSLTAVYDALSVQNWSFVPIMSDIKSDDAFCGGDASGNDMEYWQEQEHFSIPVESDAAKNLWNRCYSGIYRANLFIEKADGIQWETDGLKTRMLGEAKFLRAYFYWDLVRHYGWVPLITTNLPNIEDYKNLLQSTPEQVYSQIATDLLDAEAGCPTSVSSSELGRVTKYAAESLMARIYLFYQGFAKPVFGITNEWTSTTGTAINKAYIKTALETFIKSGAHSLMPTYAEEFDWANDHNTKEDVFSWQYDSKSKTGDWGNIWNVNGNFEVVFYGPRSGFLASDGTALSEGWSFAVPTWSLYNEFEAGDPRRDVSIFDGNTLLSSYTAGFQNTGYFNAKFMPEKAYESSGGGDPRFNWIINYPDIRYADVLLMASEIFLTDNPSFSLECFNKVRTRAMGELAAKGSITLDDIYHERRVELSGEGHRYWDLLRRGFDYTAQKIDLSFNIPAGVSVKEDDFTPLTFKPESYGMFPIPAVEIRNGNANILKQFIPAYQ